MRIGTVPGGKEGEGESQGGMGTKDVINDSLVIGGLAITERKPVPVEEEDTIMVVEVDPIPIPVAAKAVEETLDQRALRELLAGQMDSSLEKQDDLVLALAADNRQIGPVDQEEMEDGGDSFKRDLDSRPDEVSSFLLFLPSV